MEKIKVKIINNTTLEILEDAKVGDQIDLNSIESIDTSFLNKSIEKEFKYKLDEALEKEKENIRNELKAKYDEEKNALLSEKDKNIAKLNWELDSLKDKQNLLIETEKTKITSELNKEISRLNNEKEKLALENQNTLLERESKLKEIIKEKDLEISELKIQKNSLGTKQLGEELEKWCNNEYNAYALMGFENCTWEKDNTSIKDAMEEKGTKGDYIFKVFQDSSKEKELTSVMLEMKNESNTGKTKNSDHYDKLNKDREKKECKYALLVSELERDLANDVPIKKVAEYKDMYVVRPEYFMTFLSLINSLTTKFKYLFEEKIKEDILFQTKGEILEKFDEFKNTYLDKPLKALIEKVEAIKKNSLNIQDNNNKVLELCDKMLNEGFVNMRSKIDTLGITKLSPLIRKIEKLEK